MRDVFISHITPNCEIAEIVVNDLENNGVSCFFAPRDLPGGAVYSKELVNAIKNCRLLLFLFSEKVNRRKKNVLAELEIAWKNDIPCFIVKLDNSDPDDDISYYISSRNMIICYPDIFSVYLPQITNSVKGLLLKEDSKESTTVFKYIPKYGLMINPLDNERNVSFRTDTFINMMSGIYENIVAIKGEATAQEILFQSGYESGKTFANRINSQWGNSFSVQEMYKKIQSWSDFDAAVGWGKIEADIQLGEENDILTGILTITEAFIVDTWHKRKICSFIRGYCTGVLNTLLGDPDVELVCQDCRLEKKTLNNRTCVFYIKMKS